MTPISDKLPRAWAAPLVLLFLSLLSYGLLIPWLGFYWDDWPGVWISHSLGADGLREYTADSRPFEGWLFALATALLGEAPLPWHVLALLTRWLSAVAVWWCLRGLWPGRTREVAGVAFLFAVYPGFTVQPMAWIHSQGYFIPLVLFIFSLGAMVRAQRAPEWFWPLTAASLASSALSMMVIEHFVGLELLRPVLLWLVLSEQVTTGTRRRLRHTLANWSPYLAVLGTFLIWRLFLFRPPVAFLDQAAHFNSLAAGPLSWLKGRAVKAFTDVIEAGLMAWGQPFRPDIFGAPSAWLAWALVLAGAAAVILYLTRPESPAFEFGASAREGARAGWARQAVVLGALAVLLGGLPVWFANRQVHLNSHVDRYTLAMMFGACVFLAGLIQLTVRSRRQQTALLGLIVGLSVGFHFRNADKFRRDWLTQKSLFWQLSWRAPALEPGTLILMDNPPLELPADYALAAPVNFIYAPEHSSARLELWALNLSEDLGEKIPRLADGVRLDRALGSLSFGGSTSDALGVWFSPPGCLRLLDPRRDEIPQLSPLARAARSVSHTDRVVTDAGPGARPPAKIFGPEPERCWCYYFQKADLARQTGDWQRVAQIGDEARRLGFGPADATEWLPFVEGYANAGRYDDAREAAELALRSALARPSVCGLLKRLGEKAGPQNTADETFIADMDARLSCQAPPAQARGGRASPADDGPGPHS